MPSQGWKSPVGDLTDMSRFLKTNGSLSQFFFLFLFICYEGNVTATMTHRCQCTKLAWGPLQDVLVSWLIPLGMTLLKKTDNRSKAAFFTSILATGGWVQRPISFEKSWQICKNAVGFFGLHMNSKLKDFFFKFPFFSQLKRGTHCQHGPAQMVGRRKSWWLVQQDFSRGSFASRTSKSFLSCHGFYLLGYLVVTRTQNSPGEECQMVLSPFPMAPSVKRKKGKKVHVPLEIGVPCARISPLRD